MSVRCRGGWIWGLSLTLHPHLPGPGLAEPGISPAPPCSLEQDPGLLCGAAAGGGVWESGGPDGTSADGCVPLQGSSGIQGSLSLYGSPNALRGPGWGWGEVTRVRGEGRQNNNSDMVQGHPPDLLLCLPHSFWARLSFQPSTSASGRPFSFFPLHKEALPSQGSLLPICTFPVANHIPLPLQTLQTLPMS